MQNLKLAIAVAASSLATLVFVIACGAGPTPVKASDGAVAGANKHHCAQWEVKSRKGDLDTGKAIALPSGWKPFAFDGGTLYSRRCARK